MTITMRILLSIRDHDSDQILEKNQLTLMSISNGDPVEDPDQDSTFRTVTPRFAFDQTQLGVGDISMKNYRKPINQYF